METRQARVFLAVAEELHFSRAAERLNVVPSAVSHTLKSLEEEVGTPLFLRNSRGGVMLTPAGTRLLGHARRSISELATGVVAARRAALGELGRMRLGFTSLATMTTLPLAVASFLRLAPDVALEMESASSSVVLEGLLHGDYDVGILVDVDAAKIPGMKAKALARPRLAVFMHDKHPFAKRRNVPIQSLHGEQMFQLSERAEPEIDRSSSRLLASQGVEPRVVLECDQLEPALAMVATGVGLALAPELGSTKPRKVVARPIAPKHVVTIWTVWKQADVSPIAQRFLDLLHDGSV